MSEKAALHGWGGARTGKALQARRNTAAAPHPQHPPSEPYCQLLSKALGCWGQLAGASKACHKGGLDPDPSACTVPGIAPHSQVLAVLPKPETGREISKVQITPQPYSDAQPVPREVGCVAIHGGSHLRCSVCEPSLSKTVPAQG